MNELIRALRGIIGDLVGVADRWALVGGLAVSVRSEPRTTRDVDIAVAVPNDDAAEELVRSLLRRRYGVMAAVEQTATGRLSTIRLEPPGAGAAGAVVDLLFASSGIEAEVCEGADRLEVIEGIVAPVASVGHLIAMKLLSRDDDARPQDVIDLRALVQVASRVDLAVARSAVELIESRGCARGRDLTAALADVQRRFGGSDEVSSEGE